MSVALSTIEKLTIKLATRDLPLATRIDFPSASATTLALLFRGGLPVRLLAKLAEVTPQTIYNRIKTVYSHQQYMEVQEIAFRASRELHCEVLRQRFFEFRNSPERALEDADLIHEFGGQELLARQIKAASQIGAFRAPIARPVQPLLAGV